MDWSVLMQDGDFVTSGFTYWTAPKTQSKHRSLLCGTNEVHSVTDGSWTKVWASGVLHPPESRVTCFSPETLSSDLTHQCDSHGYSSTTEQNASVSKPLVDRVRELLNNRSICYPRVPDGAVCGWSPVFGHEYLPRTCASCSISQINDVSMDTCENQPLTPTPGARGATEQALPRTSSNVTAWAQTDFSNLEAETLTHTPDSWCWLVECHWNAYVYTEMSVFNVPQPSILTWH